ncbi:CrcB family protein [Streptomyces sp. NPDC097619]|uniref:fluoride efflux transporter FluC n=1 Tax=Streptomyces sp. NPDC097619 TaxID=3157228 RepID=UPI0033267C5E
MTSPIPPTSPPPPPESAPSPRPEPVQGRVLAVVSAGGVLGALSRHAAGQLWPVAPGGFPWTTFGVNLLGCAFIGVLMPLVAEGGRVSHPLLRPFLGTGVLGGFTTFSAYALEGAELLERGEAGTALAYVGGTLLGALGAVWAAASLTRRLLGRSPDGPATGAVRAGGAR